MNTQEKGRFAQHEVVDEEALNKLRDEQQERLAETIEKRAETGKHENLEADARHEALEQAQTIEKEQQNEKKAASPAERRGPLSKREKDASFNATMGEIRSHMSAPSKAFSSFIHNKAVEKVSETVGSTVARPNAILTGSVFAFIFTLTIYLIANYNGYPISGGETIASFALGWILGLVFDYLRVIVTGKTTR